MLSAAHCDRILQDSLLQIATQTQPDIINVNGLMLSVSLYVQKGSH
jgi:hypothetical protein